MNRRRFLKTGTGVAGGLAAFNHLSGNVTGSAKNEESYQIFRKELFKEPVIIESLDLFKIESNWFVRVRSTDGAEGWAISHNSRMPSYFAIFLRDVAPYFIGKDARDIETLVDGVFEAGATYKNQGQSLWICVASAEFAILDLLGRVSGEPVAELLGGIVREEIPLYIANNHRSHDWEESLRRIIESVERFNAPAVKFKIGGRMKRIDTFPGRTEKLIPAVAKALGERCVLYADSNSSYVDPNHAIKIGRLLEANGFAMYEEPCPFDDLEGLKKVADALDITIAGGEQESSFYRFKWMIQHGAVQLSQPDIIYYGGLIRSLRVAYLSQRHGIQCTPHISGVGMGFLYMLVFASCAPALGPYQEFKGVNRSLPWESPGVDFDLVDGKLPAPKGPGMGVNYDPDYLKKAKRIDRSIIP